MKQLFKQLFILTPILVCIGFLASIGHVVRSERENSLHRQFQVTVEDVDQIDRIITFASTRRKKCDMEFMRWIDNTIGAATSEEVVATILSSELQPLNKRVRHNRNVANHLVKDTAIIELLNGSESGGILINNKSVSPYDAMIYFKWVEYDGSKYCIFTVTKSSDESSVRRYLITYVLILTVVMSVLEIFIVGHLSQHRCNKGNEHRKSSNKRRTNTSHGSPRSISSSRGHSKGVR